MLSFHAMYINAEMVINFMVSLITLTIISQDAHCNKSTEIELINDFLNTDSVKSLGLVIFVCWNNVEKYTLLQRLYQNNLLAAIYKMDAKFVYPRYPAESTMYLLDLDCENVTDILSEAHDYKLFAAPFRWLLLTKNDKFITEKNYLIPYNMLPDSNIILALESDKNKYNIFEIFKQNNYTDYLIQNKISKWTLGVGFKNWKLRAIASERRDLNGTVLKAPVVVLHNESIQHLTDYRDKHIDSLSKLNYIFLHHIIDFVNGTGEIWFMNSWGYYDKNIKMFSGMIGHMQRNEAEIGGTVLYMTVDRVKAIDYIAMTTPTRAKFIFRQPPLSYAANIFTLPFTREVWISCFGLISVAAFFLYITVAWELNHPETETNDNAMQNSLLDSIMLTIGAVAQQGVTSEPRNGSGRIVMICIFIALMFLYVSYSANIVALLQSSATNIQTLQDLLQSRLQLGVDDNIYNHYFFERADEPIRKAIYEKKIAPKGQKPSFMNMDEGVRKMRAGFYAFHVELGAGYKLVGDTFLESEKCGLHEIEYLELVEPYFSVKKNSNYKEIFKMGFRKIQESGVQSREIRRIYTKKPECLASGGNFVSVGLIDAYPPFLILGAGIGISAFLFIAEKIANQKIKCHF